MLQALRGGRIAAIDIGSGTVKLSVFGVGEDGRAGALELHEIDTQLRRGMGAELTLKDGPLGLTFNAVAALKRRAREFEPAVLGVYATSALRRAANPEMLLEPLWDELGLRCRVLSQAWECRLNLLGARLALGPGDFVAVDPGGDSTDCAFGLEWESAAYASLPFGSVALAESRGQGAPGEPISPGPLEAARQEVAESLSRTREAAALVGRQPVIRMNESMRLFLETVRTDGGGPGFAAGAAWDAAVKLGGMDHHARRRALPGEPEGKLDRTPFGWAGWAGLLDFLGAPRFVADPWGIKLGACVAAALALGPWKEQ